jgi:hypothetical protein
VSAPDDSGDGQNEFTYSSASTGVLTMDLKMLVKPAGCLAATPYKGQKLKDRCKFILPQITGSTFAWDLLHTDGKPTVSGDNLICKATYTTLPANNTDFGAKQAEFQRDGANIANKGDFEVFYDGVSANHPGGVATDPNWFFYYKQNEGSSSYGYVAVGRSQSAPGGGDTSVKIGNEAYTGDQFIKTSVASGQLTASGWSSTNKYYANFLGVLAHERQHANNETTNTSLDPDGDFLSSTFETGTSSTSPTNKFSAQGSLSGTQWDDGEVYAGGPVEENGIKNADTSKDWANPGTNHK